MRKFIFVCGKRKRERGGGGKGERI